jgi:hypothetical protein
VAPCSESWSASPFGAASGVRFEQIINVLTAIPAKMSRLAPQCSSVLNLTVGVAVQHLVEYLCRVGKQSSDVRERRKHLPVRITHRDLDPESVSSLTDAGAHLLSEPSD